MNPQKEGEKVKMSSWLLKLLSRDMKTKTKDKNEPTSNQKNYRKIKAMGNITLTMD